MNEAPVLHQAELFKGPRISRVTLGRLHNLGNYEHIRYEVTVELPPGTSPASVIGELEELLGELMPKRTHSAWTVRSARQSLADQEATGGARDENDVRDRRNWTQIIATDESQRAQHEAALARFNQFGGTSVFTDAKENWDVDG